MNPIEITIKDPELLKKYEAEAYSRPLKEGDVYLNSYNKPVIADMQHISDNIAFIVLAPKQIKVCCDTCRYFGNTGPGMTKYDCILKNDKAYCSDWKSESGHTIKPQIQEPESE